MVLRRCTRTGCRGAAVATLTYVYAEQTAVLGPLSPEHVPGSYDLCRTHCDSLSAPRGWDVIRLPDLGDAKAVANGDDLLALADAVREVGFGPDEVRTGSARVAPGPATPPDVVVLAERRHLRVLGDRGDATPR